MNKNTYDQIKRRAAKLQGDLHMLDCLLRENRMSCRADNAREAQSCVAAAVNFKEPDHILNDERDMTTTEKIEILKSDKEMIRLVNRLEHDLHYAGCDGAKTHEECACQETVYWRADELVKKPDAVMREVMLGIKMAKYDGRDPDHILNDEREYLRMLYHLG